VVIAAVQRYGWALEYADESLKSDGRFLCEIWEMGDFEDITEDSAIFRYCSDNMREKLREDPEHLMEYAETTVKPAKPAKKE